MNQERIKKLESISRELVSHYILEELDDSELNFGIITVTGVKISSDLSYLDIFVSSLINGESLTKVLAKHNKQIQGRFNRALSIRKLPKIRFRYDDRGSVGQEICDVIKTI